MTRTIRVSPVVVREAQRQVRELRAAGRPVNSALLKVAQATPVREPAQPAEAAPES